jgi:hypothetical protein
MASLQDRLKTQLTSLQESIELAESVLRYMTNVISGSNKRGNYIIHFADNAGMLKYVRPINVHMFVAEPRDFLLQSHDFLSILQSIKAGNRSFSAEEKAVIDNTLYTIQQSFGVGMDLQMNSNAARKHVGNRFEELMRLVFTEIGVTNKNGMLKIPYGNSSKQRVYNCENDIILSPFKEVHSSGSSLHEQEIIVSIKTSSKDRMGKIFIDKMLLEKFVGHKQKVIGIFLNDVQRKESDNISFTLVSGLFMVYTQFLTELDGVYYLDPPPNALIEPWSDHIRQFSDLLTTDVFRLLSS